MTGPLLDPRVSSLAARLLRDAANFFDTVAVNNPALHDAFTANAETYREVADLLDADPLDTVDVEGAPATIAEVAVRQLHDAAVFFGTVGRQNPDFEAEMAGNAEIYVQLAEVLAADPLASLPMDIDGSHGPH